MRKMDQWKDQTVEELKILHKELSRDVFELNNEIMLSRKIDRPHLVRQKKKDRARILTLIRQKSGVNI
ncbi:MAG: 50S ribosomal protein L29 [Chlamydiae bacterium]|nr:50S ribosomal protein L29 [Chlamydiota bacterium]